MLMGSAAFAALGLAPRFALARGKKKKGGSQDPSLEGKELAAVEAKHPPGRENVMETPLSGDAKRLADVLFTKTKSAFAIAAANPSAKFQPGSLHAIGAAAIAKQSAKRQARAKTRAAAMLAAPAATKTATFGAYAKAELASATVKQAPDVQLTAIVKEVATKNKDAQQNAEKTKSSADKDKDPVFTRQMFQLNSIKCIESQEHEDELMIDGNMIMRDGTILKLDRINYQGWEDGETRYKDYEPCVGLTAEQIKAIPFLDCPHGSNDNIYRGRKLVEADLPGKGSYGLVIVIGEQDPAGGFGDMMKQVYDALKSEIDAALKELGVVITDGLTAWLGPIGTIIGEALSWLLGAVVGWLVDALSDNDDYITTKQWNFTLDSRKQKYIRGLEKDPLPAPKDQYASPMKKWTLEGDGAKYEMRLHWRAYAT
jgi:hypothetical protein